MTSANPGGPGATAPSPAGAAPALPGILLLLAMAVLLAIGVAPFLPRSAAVPLALALFLLAGGGIRTALLWSFGAALAGSVLFFIAAVLGTEPAGEAMAAYLLAVPIVELVWLALITLLAWRLGPARRVQGPVLALVVATSPFAAYPALAFAGLFSAYAGGAQGSFGIVAVIILGSVAFSTVIALLLTAALVWAARKPGPRLAPMQALAVVAGVTLLLRLMLTAVQWLG